MNGQAHTIIKEVCSVLQKQKNKLTADPYLELGNDAQLLTELEKEITAQLDKLVAQLGEKFTIERDVAAANRFFQACAGLKQLAKLLEEIKKSHYGTYQNTQDTITAIEDCLRCLDQLQPQEPSSEPTGQSPSFPVISKIPIDSLETTEATQPSLELIEPTSKTSVQHLPSLPSIQQDGMKIQETNQHLEPTKLLNILKKYFDHTELREMYLHLNIGYDDLGGEERATDKYVRLVEHCKRHIRLGELEKKVRELRPEVFGN